MATIKRFEDIDAWKKARELTQAIYQASNTGGFARDFGLRDQIRRASVSVMLNIAEGFERDGRNELRQFLSMAKGSVGEVRAALYVALDADFIDSTEFDRLYGIALETSRLIAGFLRYLSTSATKGLKYREPPQP